MAAKILIIDDDVKICALLKRYLVDSGYAVIYADSGSEGLLLIRESMPDIAMIDAEMPGLDGYAVCRVIKKEAITRHLPVILMSGSRQADKDVVSGFEGGADDYVMKPFALPVILARIQALLKRCAAANPEKCKLKKHGIEIDASGRTVKVDGTPMLLTRKEFDLLSILLEKEGHLLSIPYLLETVWGYDPAVYNDPDTVGVHISHLRKKLGVRLGRCIVNVIGHGYKFSDLADAS